MLCYQTLDYNTQILYYFFLGGISTNSVDLQPTRISVGKYSKYKKRQAYWPIYSPELPPDWAMYHPLSFRENVRHFSRYCPNCQPVLYTHRRLPKSAKSYSEQRIECCNVVGGHSSLSLCNSNCEF